MKPFAGLSQRPLLLPRTLLMLMLMSVMLFGVNGAGGEMTPRLTPPPNVPQKMDGIRLEVVDIVEKRLANGEPMMRVRVEARSAAGQQLLEFTTDISERRWAGWHFHYRGGW